MGKDLPKNFDHTIIDLGEDLLNTKTLTKPVTEESLQEPTKKIVLPDENQRESDAQQITAEEALVNAKILMGENLYEQAKQSLRASLRKHPDHLGLREKLNEIFQIEIKNLLEDREQRKPKKNKKTIIESQECETLQSLMGAEFDKEASALTLEDQQKYLSEIEKSSAYNSPRDCLDLGTAFFEMGLFYVAAALFQNSARSAEFEQTSIELRARCFFEMRQPFDAVMELQPLLNDSSVLPENKCEASYWIARSQELLGKYDEAVLWYRITDELKNDYRDCKERAYLCAKKSSSSSH